MATSGNILPCHNLDYSTYYTYFQNELTVNLFYISILQTLVHFILLEFDVRFQLAHRKLDIRVKISCSP